MGRMLRDLTGVADKEREAWLREYEEDGKRYWGDVRRYREESLKSELG